MAELQNSAGDVIQRSNRGWTLVNADPQIVETTHPRLCDVCGDMKRPAWRFATICWYCFAGDYEKAWRQRGRQIREALKQKEAA